MQEKKSNTWPNVAVSPLAVDRRFHFPGFKIRRFSKRFGIGNLPNGLKEYVSKFFGLFWAYAVCGFTMFLACRDLTWEHHDHDQWMGYCIKRGCIARFRKCKTGSYSFQEQSRIKKIRLHPLYHNEVYHLRCLCVPILLCILCFCFAEF